MSVDEAVQEEKSRRRRDGENEDEESDEEELGSLTERKGRATPSSKRKRDEQGGWFGSGFLSGVREYFGGVRDEMDKVVWPTRRELFRLAQIVFTVTVLSAAVLGIVSLFYNQVFVWGINDGQPIVFVLLFGAVGLGYFMVSRRSGSDLPR